MFFPIHQWPCHNKKVVDKGLNLFYECATERGHLCPQEEECNPSSRGDGKMYTPGTIGNSQTDRGRQMK